MRRGADTMIGIAEGWQIHRGWIELSDGRRAACAVHAQWPPVDPIPLATKHLLWRQCVWILKTRRDIGSLTRVCER